MTIPTTAAQASAFTQDQYASQVGVAVAAKVQDAQRQAGADALKLLSAAVAPLASTASTNGIGGVVDVRA